MLILIFAIHCYFNTAVRAQSEAEDQAEDSYTIPLLGKFVLSKGFGFTPAQREARFTIKEQINQGYSRFEPILSVHSIAIKNALIVGQSKDSFFVLDTADTNPIATLYPTRESWEAALAVKGIPAPIELKAPNTFAIGIPDMTLHPGLSTTTWSIRHVR